MANQTKTVNRILQRFCWPGVFRDVEHYCRACNQCQKSSPRGVNKAPMIPLPIVEEPFKRIAMDVVGPQPRSSLGKRFILVICDYATQYPEAIPLRNVDANTIAEELVKFFARLVSLRKSLRTRALILRLSCSPRCTDSLGLS